MHRKIRRTGINKITMRSIWRTATIFISSTFQDMQFERDLISRTVVPELKEYFKFYRIAVRSIDLRWGINTIDNEENEVERKIVGVCMDEIDRSRPFFVGIIGNRYGWIPPADLNACAKSVTEMEIDYGALRDRESLENSIICIRDIEVPEDLQAAYYENNPVKIRKINDLREQLRKAYADASLAGNFMEYKAGWNVEMQAPDGLSVLSDFLVASLKRLICRQFGIDDNDNNASQNSDYEILDSIFDDYIHSCLTAYISREPIEKNITDFLKDNRLCYITGSRGNGKSTLLCRLSDSLKSSDIVLYYNENLSTSMDKRLECLTLWDCRLSSILSVPFEESVLSAGSAQIYSRKVVVRRDINFRLERLKELSCRLARSGRRIICLIDIADRHLRNDFLELLHGSLPEFAFVAAVPDSFAVAGDFDVPPFNEKEVVGYLMRQFGHYDKELHKSVVGTISGKVANRNGNAMWLNVMSYLLLNLDASDFVAMSSMGKGGEENIEDYLVNLVRRCPDNPEGLFKYLYNKSISQFDKDLVERSLAFIGISKNGLRDEDLERLLGEKWDSLAFAAFRRWFSPFLTESADARCWDFSSPLFKECISSMIAADSASYESALAELLWNYDYDEPMRQANLFYHLARSGMYGRCGETIVSVKINYIGPIREMFEVTLDEKDAKVLICNIVAALSPEERILAVAKLLIQILHNMFANDLHNVLEIIDFVIERTDFASDALSDDAMKSMCVMLEEAILFIKQSGDDSNFLKYNKILMDVALRRQQVCPSKESRTSVSIAAGNLAKYHLSHGDAELADEFFRMI